LETAPHLRKLANTFADVLRAARLKTEHALSYADCFVAHTALTLTAPVITGDPEFKKTENIVTIQWV
jgi:ribonuclease VapC